ncbi:MAG: hypothetical protein ACKVK8_03700 [Rhodospirillales bacterium]|jgi:4,5-dihydroxyphthalate decarboxylase
MKLSIGIGGYDRTWPLIAGAIKMDGTELNWEIVPPEVAFVRGQVDGNYQLSELSFCTHLVQLARGTNLYTAIPVYPSRSFRHSAIYVRADAGIERPEDLIGRNIGGSEWQLTANVWARGILSDDYGVSVDKVHWYFGGIDVPGRSEKVPLTLPPHIKTTRIAANETLWSLMSKGTLDAIIGPRAPAAFIAGNPRVRRLFADVKGAEQDYFRQTGIFPIMHLLGIRNDVLAAHPELPPKLFNAFEAARFRARCDLDQVAYLHVMLPWLIDHIAETKQVMGDDYWTYGVDGNRKTIDTMCRYAFEQGLTDRKIAIEELFAPE